jgi:hypothetical protein
LYETLVDKASHLVFSLIKNHPFIDGNKRIGVTTMIVFLESNDVEISCRNEELVKLGLGVANGSFCEYDIRDWIHSHVETLMASRLWEKFPQYNFNRTFQRIKILDKNKTPVTEIDILLSDSEWAMAVEVKREPDKGDVEYHLKRMELMREYSLGEIIGKKLLGAIAGGVVPPDVRAYAHESGLYVLELNGEQVSLLESPENFVALQG